MKKALISPLDPVAYVSGWTTDTPPEPIVSNMSNAYKVAEIEEVEFEVSPPLFWTDISDDLATKNCYYDTSDDTIKEVIDAPAPA